MNNMSLFKNFPDPQTAAQAPKPQRVVRQVNGRPLIIRDASDKPYVSPNEIRRKVAEKSKGEMAQASARAQKRMSGQKLGAGFLKDADEAQAVASDVATNDPNDPVTREKLKNLLSTGGVNFDEKHQRVLAEILNKQT